LGREEEITDAEAGSHAGGCRQSSALKQAGRSKNQTQLVANVKDRLTFCNCKQYGKLYWEGRFAKTEASVVLRLSTRPNVCRSPFKKPLGLSSDTHNKDYFI